MDTTPPRTLGIAIGLGLCLAGLAATALGLAQLSQAEISAALLVWATLPIVGIVLTSMAGYRLYGLFTARYLLNRNGLGLRWGQAIEEVPLPEVRLARPSESEQAVLRLRRGLRWPGCVVGTTTVEGLGPVEFFATRGPADTLLVRTPRRTLAISPPDIDAFQRAFVEASRQGVLDPIEPRSERPDLFPARLWADPLARILLVPGIGLVLVLLGFLGLRAGTLPDLVPFGFDTAGVPYPLVPPGRLLLLPLIGGLCWAANLLLGAAFYHQPADKSLAYALWGLTLVVDILLWGAALILVAAA